MFEYVAPRSIVTDCGSVPVDCQRVSTAPPCALSIMPSMASPALAVALLAVAVDGVTGYSRTSGCAGSGGREVFGFHSGPTALRALTMFASNRPWLFGGQFSRNEQY